MHGGVHDEIDFTLTQDRLEDLHPTRGKDRSAAAKQPTPRPVTLLQLLPCTGISRRVLPERPNGAIKCPRRMDDLGLVTSHLRYTGHASDQFTPPSPHTLLSLPESHFERAADVPAHRTERCRQDHALDIGTRYSKTLVLPGC